MSTNRSGGRLRFLDQSDAEAALLRARLEAVTRLAALTNRTRLDVEREAAALGLSAVTLYKLLRRYLDDPKPESVLEQRRGWTKGRPRLDSQTTDIITAAIDDTYLTREKPPVSKLVREINGRLRRAGLKEVIEAGGEVVGVLFSQVDTRRHAQYEFPDSGRYHGYRRYYAN